MTMNPDYPARMNWTGLFAKRGSRELSHDVVRLDDREATCARRESLNRIMCENAGAVEGEHGMQAMMSMYPREL